MVVFTKINCVQRSNGLIIAFNGIAAPSSSDGIPSEKTVRAIDELQGVMHYRLPDQKEKIIQYYNMNGTNCFLIESKNPGENLLDEFPDCN
jgi:hypothetical protein